MLRMEKCSQLCFRLSSIFGRVSIFNIYDSMLLTQYIKKIIPSPPPPHPQNSPHDLRLLKNTLFTYQEAKLTLKCPENSLSCLWLPEKRTWARELGHRFLCVRVYSLIIYSGSESIFDIMTHFLTSWRVCFMSWRVFDVITHFLTSWRIF